MQDSSADMYDEPGGGESDIHNSWRPADGQPDANIADVASMLKGLGPHSAQAVMGRPPPPH